ncbi:volume-regulated anion channel subunit LRRC8D [Gouania willdenowi]|uniref:Volume-regulated anion channel subunit LRRC8D-like n=1 Tax=Gouania willdenowi TaxID=441366 RepID=A0A8C5EGZ2_GOUWI|nr:volume-regulated anion channel subunit LRRC8D-like [Gouania willdenowi]XP_028310462.1 volume-regulated anion channel subunit LRRC8D-like [Gouania willdenowi]
MFSLSELAPVHQHESRTKLLKPWWEVFMDYLVVLMLLTSVLACTEQLSRDRVVCIPLDPSVPDNTSASSASTQTTPTARGRRIHLVYQQYVYISQVCYNEALPLGSRFFPYLALLQSLILVASGSFWLHFPHTSSRIEQFLAILSKCCDSPWTSQALSLAAGQGDIQEEMEEDRQRPQVRLSSNVLTRRSSCGSGTESPLLKRTDSLSSHSCSPITSAPPCEGHTDGVSPKLSVAVDDPRQAVTLDKSDREQARALFERVRKFRSHCENSTIIQKVYLTQTIFKVLMVMLILSYTLPLLHSFSFNHTCHLAEFALLGYDTFDCIHVLSSLLLKLVTAYVFLLGLYGLLSLHTLCWVLLSSLRQYSFHSRKEIEGVPDLRNDLAFLIHMLEQYDALLVQRLTVFLSPISESRLLEDGLERCWDEKKLHAMTSVDADGHTQLQLVALRHLPPALFTLSQLQVLKLELISDARLSAQVANMTALRELHLYHCSATVDLSALTFLQERIEILHLSFTQASEISHWVLSLCNLHELHLSGRLSSEGGVGRGWALGSLRQLRHLRVLVIQGMLQRIPAELCELSGCLTHLKISNEGAKLLVLTSLKRMVELMELQLQDCQLERIPSALLSLTNLRTLDLQHNNLRTLEEILGLAHLQRLSSLRLAYNHVLVLPATIGVLRSLEFLDLSNNRLQSLPSALFSLHRLRKLLLAGNLIESLPTEVKELLLLSDLDLSGNRLENLPPELFSHCQELQILNVACNSLSSLPNGVANLRRLCKLDLRCNSLEKLPAELGSCSSLHGGGLSVENWLFLTLPATVREVLTHSFIPVGKYSESRPESDSFPYFCPSQWSFNSALESEI